MGLHGVYEKVNMKLMIRCFKKKKICTLYLYTALKEYMDIFLKMRNGECRSLQPTGCNYIIYQQGQIDLC